MLKKLVSICVAGALFPISALAQDEEPSRYDRALAAGYKAQFICSGLWNGGKSLADIKADELTGIYDRIADIVPTLPEEIDHSERQVRVPFADDAPPRVAIWNRKNGCTSMPIGFGGLKTGGPLSQREYMDDQPWPMGDITPPPVQSASEFAARVVTERAFDASTYGAGSKTSGVLIVHKNNIQAEQYKAGHDLHTAQRTWSVAKSIAGTLIGHSVQQNMVDVSARASLPQWQKFGDPRNFITIDNLMRMASGLTSDTAGNRTDGIYMGATSVSQQSTSWSLLDQPGTKFRYANNDTLLAVLAVQAAHEDKKYKLSNYMPEEHDFDPFGFFQKLGMTRTYAETDWQDNYILSSQVWTTARDLGRLGQLYLNNGVWNGERLIPENWREYVSKPSGPQPEGRDFGYGATFWLMNNSDGVPADAFAAFGNRGQYLVIIPSLDLVIVRRGYDMSDGRFDIAAFTRDVIAVLTP
ncbi:serine hydrolase domain-containing protein [Parasphingorhabdus sp.]|uniref:serine hydrolase domain-containing protein n=1 Tax=Parasphingorhabdus sp. TaxID=2709688 RepID=UPI003C787FA4